jgi:hypothetical protein
MANPVILRTSSSGDLRPAKFTGCTWLAHAAHGTTYARAAGLGCYMSSVADSDFFTLTNLM